MKLILFTFLSFSFLQPSCQKYLGAIKRPSIDTVISFSGKQVVFIGNSITAGYSATNQSTERWTYLFCQNKGAIENNMGISGQVMQDYWCGRTIFDTTTIPVKTTQAALFISLGTNDIGINNGFFTPDAFQQKLDKVVQHAVNLKGWHYSDIVLVTPYYESQAGYDSYIGTCGTTTAANSARHEAYVLAVKTIAAARHTVLADIYTSTRDNPLYASNYLADGIHPNTAGHQYIATFMTNLSYRQQ